MMCSTWRKMREFQKKEPLVIKSTPKLLRQGVKSTQAVAQGRKNKMSEYMNMFTMFIENSLPQMIMIGHDTAAFGEIWETHLDKIICHEIIEFKEVSNYIINLWIRYVAYVLLNLKILFSFFYLNLLYYICFSSLRYLYEEMENNESANPIQFGLFKKLHLKACFKDKSQYI